MRKSAKKESAPAPVPETPRPPSRSTWSARANSPACSGVSASQSTSMLPPQTMSLAGVRPVRSQKTRAEMPLSRLWRAASTARASSAPPPTVPSSPAGVSRARVPA